MFFIPLLFLFFLSTDRTSALVLVEVFLGISHTFSHETIGQHNLSSLKTPNFIVQHDLCLRLVKSSTVQALLSASHSHAAPLGLKRITPSTVGGTIVITDKSSTAGEILLKGPSHRYLWFSLRFAPRDCHNLQME